MNQICQLSIVIINYKSPGLVKDCLKTVLPEIRALDAKVVIVDNNSGDNSAEVLNNWLLKNDTRKKVKLFLSDENLGFSGGNNLGINAIRAEYYLLLNSDTLVRGGAIQSLLDTIKHNPHAGIVSPCLEWPDGTPETSCFRYPTPISELIASADTGPITRLFKNHYVPLPISKQIIHPPWTSFACVLIRHDMFTDIGLMDDNYFMYYEDIDFCRRARKAGWDIIHNPIARVIHLHGGSSALNDRMKQRKRLPRYYYESRTRYMYTYYGRAGLFAANIFWSIGRIIAGLREIFGNKKSHICDKQIYDIWINYFQPLKPYTRP